MATPGTVRARRAALGASLSDACATPFEALFRALSVACVVTLGACGGAVEQPPTSGAGVAADDGAERAPQRAADASDTLYDREFPALGYTGRAPSDAVAQLGERIANAGLALPSHPQRGILDALLAQLGIDPASQLLVFSKTSLQVDGITAATPRAIYFNDDVYVAWVPGAQSIELAALDADLGPVFYAVSQSTMPDVERRFGQCLSCHDSLSLTGGGVPRFITGSGYIGRDGAVVAHEGWILTNDRTPLRSRWGGWYVSGMHGDQVHLGNIAVDSVYELEDLESLRNGNHVDLSQLLDTSRYVTDKSDIVALLVFEHQTTVQNAIVRLNWDARQERDYDIEPLVRALLMDGTPALTDRIAGTAGFEPAFAARAIRDADGRSLRDFDLQTRLFRYPLSYLIHSDAFAALPDNVRRAVMRRIDAELNATNASLEALPGDAASRRVAWEILLETAPQIAAMSAAQ